MRRRAGRLWRGRRKRLRRAERARTDVASHGHHAVAAPDQHAHAEWAINGGNAREANRDRHQAGEQPVRHDALRRHRPGDLPFNKEQTTKPQCYGACAKAWPPVLTKGTPIAADGTRPSLLGTAKRTDGTTQVTYGGHPLYFYAHEAKNEVKCHNIQGFGGLWLVVTPKGRAAAP
jgi:hypothetical protein